MPREAETLSTTDVAEMLGMHRNTIINWIRDGRLKPDLVTLGNRARFRRSSVVRLQKRMARGLIGRAA